MHAQPGSRGWPWLRPAIPRRNPSPPRRLRRTAAALPRPHPYRSRLRRPALSYRRIGMRQTGSSPSPSGRWVQQDSGHHTADLEVHDGVPVEAQPFEDAVAVLVELRGPTGDGRLPVELYRGGGQSERCAGRGLAVLDVAVGDGLRIRGRLDGVLHDGPLAVEAGQALTPLVEGGAREDLAQFLDGLPAVGHQRLVIGEPRVRGQFGATDGVTEGGPVLGGLQTGEPQRAIVRRPIATRQRIRAEGVVR